MVKTVTLETAKLLKEAGFPQTTEKFYGSYDTRICRPTTDELFEELPYRIAGNNYILELVIFKNSGDFTVGYKGSPENSNVWIENDLLPEALAQMWLLLKKERLI